MIYRSAALTLSALTLTLSGCANLFPPSASALAALPVVTYPATPPKGDFVYKLPAGQPIDTHVSIQGSGLKTSAQSTLSVTLPQDLYIHQRWVSNDRATWRYGNDAYAINLNLSLPTDESPKPGEITLTIDSKDKP